MTMRVPRLLPIAAVLIVATAGAVLLLGGNTDPAPPGPVAEPDERVQSTAPAADPATADSALGWPDDGDPMASDELPAEIREAVAKADPSQAPRIRVVRGNPPVAAADVEVLFTTTTAARERLGAALPRRRLEWPELCGARVVTDADGIAQLPLTQEVWLAIARAPAEFAFAFVPPGDRIVTLALQADEQILVTVADDDGRPLAAAPVEILQHEIGAREARVVWGGATDANGEALVRHFQFVRRRGRAAADERFAAALQLIAPAPIFAEFVGRPAQQQAVALVAPRRRPVEVLLTDHRDAALLTPAVVTLTAVTGTSEKPRFPVPRRSLVRSVQKPAGAAPVRFDWVAAGVQLRPGARFDGERKALVGDPVDVPAHADGAPAGPLATRLPLTPPYCVLSGRILIDSREPLAATRIGGVLWRGAESAGGIAVTTIDDGRFDVVRRPGKTEDLVLELLSVVGAGDARRRLGCRAPFRMPPGGERRDLGALVLGELQALCAGTVVDDEGQPVRRANVIVQRKRSAAERPKGRNRGLQNIDLGGLDARALQRFRQMELSFQNSSAALAGDDWRNVPLLRAFTDPAGHFTLYGTRPGGELRVRADTDGHLADSVAWNGTGQQLQIRIDRNGVLRGRALLPQWLPGDAASITLQPFAEEHRKGRTRTVELSRRRGGRFVVEPLHAGRYDAIIRLRNLPDPVLTIPDVFVSPGVTDDARLQAIDLRQSVHRYRLRAVDLRGLPMSIDSPLMMRWQNPDESRGQAGFRWKKGRAEFFCQSTFVELVSFAPGCEPQLITIGPGDQDIAMRRLVPAQLLLPGARALCGAGRKVRVSVILVGESGFPQWLSGIDQATGEQFSFSRWELGKSTGAWLEQSDLVSVPIVKDGKYQVILRVHADNTTRSQQISVTLGEFDLVSDGSVTAPVTLPIDAQRIQQAIARFRPIKSPGKR